MESISMNIIAHMQSDFATKFGIPRQSGLVEELHSVIIFEPEYRIADALRGIEEFSHIWILWQFSEAVRQEWSPTVRPPRLGGNTRMGVFATRSPFRPNNIGLSCVKLLGTEHTNEYGTILHVGGADLMNGTPILDIKPYIAYSDAKPEAAGGFTTAAGSYLLNVNCPEHLLDKLPREKQSALLGVLSHDPRPSYHSDPDRVYGMSFAGFEIGFSVKGSDLQVLRID